MDSTNKPPALTRKQFDVFLLIYAAHVDYEFTKEEEAYIQERTDKETYNEMLRLFLERGDFANLQILLTHAKKYYDTEKSRESLFKMLKEAFHSDGEYSRIEKVFVTFFKRLSQL